MNRRSIVSLLVMVIVAGALLGLSPSVYAHNGEATIELNVTQARPGMSIEIQGSGFEANDIATIMLMPVGSDRPQVLGTATADEQGELSRVVLLPADLIDGAYEVRVADSHHVATAELSVVTDSSDEENGQRGEDEPLLAPMPTQVPGMRQTSNVASSTTTTPPLQTADIEPPIPITLLFSSALAIVILVVGLFVISRRSR